jgi:hypothetical protein
MSKVGELASRQITGHDTITVELIAANETPAVVIIRWPARASVLHPASLPGCCQCRWTPLRCSRRLTIDHNIDRNAEPDLVMHLRWHQGAIPARGDSLLIGITEIYTPTTVGPVRAPTRVLGRGMIVGQSP